MMDYGKLTYRQLCEENVRLSNEKKKIQEEMRRREMDIVAQIPIRRTNIIKLVKP